MDWILLGTRSPQYDTKVLIYGNSWEIEIAELKQDDGNSEAYFLLQNGSMITAREFPSHWMPLPNPPSDIDTFYFEGVANIFNASTPGPMCAQCGSVLKLKTFEGHYFFGCPKACSELKAGTPEDKAPVVKILHGKTCCKEIHRAGRTGYFHGPEDDSPYYIEINGPMYCGRCHEVLP